MLVHCISITLLFIFLLACFSTTNVTMSHRSQAMKVALESSSSDDDDEFIMATTLMVHHHYQTQANVPHWGGSIPGHIVINHERAEGHDRLMKHYFSDNPTYGPVLFRRRFRMARSLYMRIVHAVENHDSYFVQRRNAAGVLGLSALQKITAAFRMIAYGVPADFLDDYLAIGESTILESLTRFVIAIIELFGEEYLRSPNQHDTDRLLAIGEEMGFPGMLGSIDCMHWKWKNCPTAWAGMYQGHVHEPTIILEAVASDDLWIWHAFFGLPGSHNDINVLDRSPLFMRLALGHAPQANYTINGNNYTMGYYLADGIYPNWATLVKSMRSPQGNKRKLFTKAQEATRKCVERAFGVLQSRFAIVRGPARIWDQETLGNIMRACIIMHNMIIEDERGAEVDYNYEYMGKRVKPSHDHPNELKEYIQTICQIRNPQLHYQLQKDLVEHLWQRHGGH